MALTPFETEVKIRTIACPRCHARTNYIDLCREVDCAACGLRLLTAGTSMYGPRGSAGITGAGLRFCALHRESWNPAAYGECPRCFGPGRVMSGHEGIQGAIGKGHDKTPVTYYTTPRELVLLCPI